MYFSRVEVGQAVAREPSFGVAHVTQVSPVFHSVSCSQVCDQLSSIGRSFWDVFWFLKKAVLLRGVFTVSGKVCSEG